MRPLMRAAVLEKRGSDGLRVQQFPAPLRNPGDVLIRIKAAGINRVDLYMRDVGVGITHELPLILGVEGAGEIVEADLGSSLKPGMKAVCYAKFCGCCEYCLMGDQPLCEHIKIPGEHIHGYFAEYISVPARCVIPLPKETDLVEAAVVPSAYLTAWRMLFGKRQLRPNETILIVGIGSGVAVACLQLALIAGARPIVTSSSDEKLKRALEIGALHGINYKAEQVYKRVLEITGGRGVDMVIDSSGEASWSDSLRSLRRGGRLVTCGATTGSNPSADLQRMFIRQLEVYGSTGGSVSELKEVMSLFSSGNLKPVIDKSFQLEDINSAFDYLKKAEQFGKLVITID